MKKISVVLVILIIFNFICSNLIAINVAYATETGEETGESGTDSSMTSTGSYSMDEYKAMADEGTTNINGTAQSVKLEESDVGATSSIFGTFFVNLAKVAARVASKFTYEGGFYYTESDYSAEKTGLFTINSLVFGEYLLFNSKAYQKSTDLNSSITPSAITQGMDTIKERGATLAQLFVKIGIALALPLTILAIVKTVSARKAADLAAWKKILVRWVLCIFFMMFFQYILATIDFASDSLIETFWNIRTRMENSGYKAFEVTVEDSITKQFEKTGGVTSLAYGIIFVGLVIMQILFLIKYLIRTLAIIFLFIVAPIVIMIHSFNLMLGKESNMLGDFFKDYFLLVFMQPLHALIYLIFFFTLSEMAINVPILGILLLFALLRATNIAKAMFGWELGSSLFTRK